MILKADANARAGREEMYKGDTGYKHGELSDIGLRLSELAVESSMEVTRFHFQRDDISRNKEDFTKRNNKPHRLCAD